MLLTVLHGHPSVPSPTLRPAAHAARSPVGWAARPDGTGARTSHRASRTAWFAGYCPAMSRVRTTERQTQAFNAGIEALLAFYDPEVICHPAAGWVPEQVCYGHDGIRRLTSTWLENVDGASLNVHEVRDMRERVLVLAELTGSSRETGEPVRQEFGVVNSDIRTGGKVGEAHFFLSWQEAREAARAGCS
jgi:hypothetical protein